MHHRAGLGAILILIGVWPLAACANSSSSVEGTPACSSSDNLTYRAFGAQFVHEYCLSCHAGSLTGDARQGAPPDYVFDTLAQIRLHSEDMHMDVVETKIMPFGLSSLKPSDALRQEFGQWLDCGAPE